MKGISIHTHNDRKIVIKKLIPIIKHKLKNNFIALAADGSYARSEDVDYSDLELVAFVKQLSKKHWEIRKIINGLYIVVIVETKQSYIDKYLDISDIWFASGASKLYPIINFSFVNKINNSKVTHKKIMKTFQ